MLRFIIFFVITGISSLAIYQMTFAQLVPESSRSEFFKAKIIEIVEQGIDEQGQPVQVWKVELLSGSQKGFYTNISLGSGYILDPALQLKPGERIIVSYLRTPDGAEYYNIADKYRLTPFFVLLAFFFVLVVYISRWKGLASVGGLCISLFVLAAFIVPKIITGSNPFFISLAGAFIIAVTSIYFAHGVSKRTTIAIVSTLGTLTFTAVLAYISVSLTKLFGLGSEEAFYLQISNVGHINLRGLLLGGIMLGALGVLDDITTAQSAVVDELKKANTTLSFSELYRRGISVGNEHVASLVNTLVLAYAGASLPLFVLFSADSLQPLWVSLNSEIIMEELVRTLVGSIGLVFAVPITTFLAAYVFSKTQPRPYTGGETAHTHFHHH